MFGGHSKTLNIVIETSRSSETKLKYHQTNKEFVVGRVACCRRGFAI
jgi:hypothetical protein